MGFKDFYQNEYELDFLSEDVGVTSLVIAWVILAFAGYQGIKLGGKFISGLRAKIKDSNTLTNLLSKFRKKEKVIEMVKQEEPKAAQVAKNLKDISLSEELEAIYLAAISNEKDGSEFKARTLWKSLPVSQQSEQNKTKLLLKIIEHTKEVPVYVDGKGNRTYIYLKNFLNKNEAQKIAENFMEIVTKNATEGLQNTV